MREIIALAATLVITACTASVPGGHDHSTLQSRVSDSCAELSATCASSGLLCTAKAAYCGELAPQLGQLFNTEATCKNACTDVTCQRICKAQRLTAVTALLTSTDLNADGVAGDGLTACGDMQTACTTTQSGCNATEFFCTLARPVQDACSMELATCKAACGHDHTCKVACKQAYLTCEMGTPMDGGTTTTPDAPTTTPDAPTTTPDAPTTTPDAPTTTAYTYTNDIKPVSTGLCNGCHSGSNPPGNYFTDSYAGLLGNGSDTTANIIPGNANSKWLLYVQGNHHNVLSLYPGFDKVAYTWVVSDAAKQ